MAGDRHEKLVCDLHDLATGVARAEGLELVELTVRGGGGRRLLRVDIDRCGPRGVDLADCQRISNALGAALDENDLISGRYTLEVSSPGIDRPIRTADDIRRNTGRMIRVSTTEPDDAGRREFRGILVGGDRDVLRLEEQPGQEVSIAMRQVHMARQDGDI